MEISITEEIEVGNVEDKADLSDLLSIYPHDLQMYNDPQTEKISLNEFESLGAERLEVLRLINTLSKQIEIKTAEDLKDSLLSVLKSKELDCYVRLTKSNGCDSNTYADIEARKRDRISHFILRLALSRKRKTRDWFISLETMLFKMRFCSLNDNGLQKFLTLYHFNYPTLSPEEKCDIRENLIAVHENIDVDNMLFYKVPFANVRNLVQDRQVYIKNGIAFVPTTDVVYAISQAFKENLLEESTSARSLAQRDFRLEPILKNFCFFTEKKLLQEAEVISPKDLDEFAKSSYPLCMKTMHEALRKNHHLRNYGRFEYGLFLKHIGLRFEDSLNFWKEEFLQKVDEITFNKKYIYNIKHAYSIVGGRKEYAPIACGTMIKEKVGFGEYHGCPYKNMTEVTLQSALEDFGLPYEDIAEIEDLAKNHKFSAACSKCFSIKHKSPVCESINSPVHYFLTSRELIAEEKRMTLKIKERRLKETMPKNEHVDPDT